MPKDEADPDDPMEMVGVQIPATGEQLEETARCFIEEFAWIGYDRPGLLRLFREPFYFGMNAIYRQKGEEWVSRLIDQVMADWGAGAERLRGPGAASLPP